MSRIAKFTQKMIEAGADAALISSELNIRYLSNFNFTDGYILVTRNRAYLITDFRYIESAKAEVNPADFEIVMPDRMSMGIAMASILDDCGAKVVMIEESALSCAGLESFKKLFAQKELVFGASKILTELRIYKDADEIEIMKKAQSITDAAFAHIIKVMKPEMTEIDVALELEFFMRKNGAEGLAFETIAVSGTASSLPHGVPRNCKLERGFLTMDFGAKYNGYCSDMTRTVVIGKADEDIKKVYNTVLLAQTSALEALHEGMPCRDADKIARDIIDKEFAGRFGHSLGHGVGLFIHEEPRLAAKVPEDVVLKRGHVVTVEPGIYLEGKYGCRIEDMVAIMPDGSVYDFTQSPKNLIEMFV